MATREPEAVAADGTVRKVHYGTGRQPWDDIKLFGWGPAFAAGNVLKYVRRAARKNGPDDLEKAQWYYKELCKLVQFEQPRRPYWLHVLFGSPMPAHEAHTQLMDELTDVEFDMIIHLEIEKTQ